MLSTSLKKSKGYLHLLLFDMVEFVRYTSAGQKPIACKASYGEEERVLSGFPPAKPNISYTFL